MHNMIFQLSIEPVNIENFLQEEDLYDSFVGEVADYVNDDIDRDEEIKNFIKMLEPYGIIYDPTEQSIIFLEGFKKKYFEKQYKKFKKLSEEMTLEDFAGCSGISAIYVASRCIENKYETYIYFYDNYMTLDDFVREMQEGQKYYFGAAIDYHI